MAITVNRKAITFTPDAKRVITRYFDLGGNVERIKGILDNIMNMPENEVSKTLEKIYARFSCRHRDLKKILVRHFMKLTHDFDFGIEPREISYNRTLLVGAYFTSEYSFESSAYFNPSIVEAPDQSGLKKGEIRVIVSFRAVGEGHVSSIVFRSGVIDANNEISFMSKRKNFVEEPEVIKRNVYPKAEFIEKLKEMKIPDDVRNYFNDRLEDPFIYGKLQECIVNALEEKEFSTYDKNIIPTIQWLAKSHYEITFAHDTDISQRVIFPISYTEKKGVEDARFVRFVDDDGKITYYAVYTAYNGFSILPRLLETEDFYHFKITPLHGNNVQNKGVALFPKKIKGKYAVLARIDGFRNYIMFSDDVHMWGDIYEIQEPKYP